MKACSVSTLLFLAIFAFAPDAHAQGGCCVLFDNGNGTVDMPPACSYFGPLEITNGIPGGTIQIAAELGTYFNVNEVPGGLLGGTSATFDAILQLTMTGTGILNVFNRVLFLPVSNSEFHFANRNSGDPVQQYAGDVFRMSGTIFGDPDFDFITITAGTQNGLPGPGVTKLTKIGPAAADPYDVESFFDIHYTITFSGAPGSILEGFSGPTTSNGIFELCPGPGGLPTGVSGPTERFQDSNWSELKRLFR